jgi:hypothetical protein
MRSGLTPHADCIGWAMACCGRDRDDAEEVLQTASERRNVKKVQISLMVRIKNTLTAAQQAKLAEIRNRKD